MMCQKLGLKRDFRKYNKRLVKVVFNDVHDRKEMFVVVHIHVCLNETRQEKKIKIINGGKYLFAQIFCRYTKDETQGKCFTLLVGYTGQTWYGMLLNINKSLKGIQPTYV